MAKKRSNVMIGMENSKIVYPKICNKTKCDMYAACLYSKCALSTGDFQECRKSGYKKNFEVKR